MSTDDTQQTEDSSFESSDDLTFTRRTALALLGIGGVGTAVSGNVSATADFQPGHGHDRGGHGTPTRKWEQDVDAQGHSLKNLSSIDVDHVYTAARDADRIVWKDEDGVFHADGRNGEVASGGDVIDVTQAAVDSLTEGRTSKEKVAVVSPGTVPNNTGDFRGIDLPSYTVLDVAATISCEYEAGKYSHVIPVRATDAEHVEVTRLTVAGGPWMAIRFQRCSNVRIGDVTILYAADADTNDGVRVDNGYDIGTPRRSENVRIESVYLENGGHHAVETFGVNRLQIDRVLANELQGCAVLLNQTSDATVNSVIGKDPGGPPGYPTFRLANFCNNVSVGQVVSRGGMKGVMLLTAHNASIGEVDIIGAKDSGIFVSASYNVSISGGVIKNCEGEAIRIHGYPKGTFYFTIPTEGITISDVRMLDDRPEGKRTQTYGIREDGPTAFSNQYVDNDVRTAGTVTPIAVSSASSVVAGNVGDGVDSGTTTLESGASPAARVTGVSPHKDATLRLREKAYEAPDAGEWDLVVEWRTDPGGSVTMDYIVDRPQANLGRRTAVNDWDEYTPMT